MSIEQLINNNTQIALTPLVAKSTLGEKELMIRLIEHFVLQAEELEKEWTQTVAVSESIKQPG